MGHTGAPEASQSATPIDELRELMRKISHTFPPPSDSLVSLFKFTPVYVEDNDEFESHWHFVNCYLNRSLGFGLTPEELAEKIASGALHLEGVCDWLETVLGWPGVTFDLLEGKLARLKDALTLL